MPVHLLCLERQARLLDLIPFHSVGDYPGSAILLEKMSDSYTGTESARRRRIERDLKELLNTGQIKVSEMRSKARYFCRLANDAANDPRLLDYIQTLSDALLKERLPSRRHEQLWAKLRDSQQRPLLAESRFRAISDSQRLLPADIKPKVLVGVLAALIQRQILWVGYRKPDGSFQRPLLHPQGLLQRGPVLYLYALKNDEMEVKMFALHRMTSASVEAGTARDDPDFDLDQRIREGDADYGRGEPIELRLRVRGYILGQLRECPLSEDQMIVEDEDEDEDDGDLTATLTATVPATGQLYRWLLGCGANIEILAPEHQRNAVAKTAAAMAKIYCK